MKPMTPEERDRLCEILFFKYFENQAPEKLSSPEFWNCINSICRANGVDSLLVSKTVRILMAKENRPEDFETWYLFNKWDTSVRQLRNFTGMYWQKQKRMEARLEAGEKPFVKRRITDVAMKASVKGFITTIYSIFGSFKFVQSHMLEELFG